jgi:hypothetical protein
MKVITMERKGEKKGSKKRRGRNERLSEEGRRNCERIRNK